MKVYKLFIIKMHKYSILITYNFKRILYLVLKAVGSLNVITSGFRPEGQGSILHSTKDPQSMLNTCSQNPWLRKARRQLLLMVNECCLRRKFPSLVRDRIKLRKWRGMVLPSVVRGLHPLYNGLTSQK